MEIEEVYSREALDETEGKRINELIARSQQPIPDPDQWLDEELKRNVLVTTVDAVLDWGRRSSMWPAVSFPACCAFEFIPTEASRFDLSRFGMEIVRASPRQADLMITAGTLTWKMAHLKTLTRGQMKSRARLCSRPAPSTQRARKDGFTVVRNTVAVCWRVPSALSLLITILVMVRQRAELDIVVKVSFRVSRFPKRTARLFSGLSSAMGRYASG